MRNCKVLITGGAGFIGGNFVHYLLQQYPHYEVYNLDLLTYAGELSKHRLIDIHSNYQFIHGDITNQSFIEKLFKEQRFDYVVHFAAESHVDRSISNPSVFIQTNVLGTHILLEAALKNEITKFIHISTDEVYGELDFDAVDLFSEEFPLQPNSPYSASKASSDLLVRSYHQTFGLPMNITRCSNNYGPYQFPEKLIPLTISNALRKEKIPVYGTGQNVRDWLHVYDHCRAIDLILHEGVNGEVYNIGGNNERTNLDIIKTILHQLGESMDLIEFVPDRLGHDKRYGINPKKLNLLGWEPIYNFEKGIINTIEWYKENKEWLNLNISKLF